MACTFGESWALFHSDFIDPGIDHHSFPSTSSASSIGGPPLLDPGLTPPILNATTRSSPRSRSSNSPTLSDHTILAEIQKLRQEINEMKRSHSSISPPEPPEVARISNQVSTSSDVVILPNDAPSTSTRGPRNNISNSANLPRCLDPCCNGRTFSNQSNLARHQREKRGEAAKLRCSFCDAVFSRSSARNTHEAEKRCRNNNNNSNDDHDDK
ncbi:hypothetical protein BDV97DRAFT_353612 [Delphinella strobiligena]|nr:hypothetical protein BDV97DRAFT_353612 [Delphinella strobiligena]